MLSECDLVVQRETATLTHVELALRGACYSDVMKNLEVEAQKCLGCLELEKSDNK